MQWGICNFVVDSNQHVVDKTLEHANMISEASSDAGIVTREGLKLGWNDLGLTAATRVFRDG